tara:strand:- start:197 stop:601 length:405 start_codon:yes stop_codon:yes gene_type:complete
MFRLSILILIAIIFSSCHLTGCTDEKACNYSSNAIMDDGSCWSVDIGCDCSYGPGAYYEGGYPVDVGCITCFIDDGWFYKSTCPWYGDFDECGQGLNEQQICNDALDEGYDSCNCTYDYCSIDTGCNCCRSLEN